MGTWGWHGPKARRCLPGAPEPKATSPRACVVLTAWAAKTSSVCLECRDRLLWRIYFRAGVGVGPPHTTISSGRVGS